MISEKRIYPLLLSDFLSDSYRNIRPSLINDCRQEVGLSMLHEGLFVTKSFGTDVEIISFKMVLRPYENQIVFLNQSDYFNQEKLFMGLEFKIVPVSLKLNNKES